MVVKILRFALISFLVLPFSNTAKHSFAIANTKLKTFTILPYGRGGGNANYRFVFGESGTFIIKAAILNTYVPPKWNSNSFIYTQEINSLSAKHSDSGNIPLFYPPLNMLTPYFHFYVRGVTNSSYLFARSIRLYMKDERVVTMCDNFTTKPNIISVYDDDLVSYSETFEFHGFNEYIESSSNFRFSLQGKSITYKCDYVNSLLSIQKGYLFIIDKDNLFPKLPHKDNDPYTKYIPISLSPTPLKGVYRISHQSLYYDPVTYILSLNREEGYKSTNYIYFPKNHYLDAQDLSYSIEFLGVGVNAFHFLHEFTYGFRMKLIGDCYDSEYCVITDEEDEELSYEETVVVDLV